MIESSVLDRIAERVERELERVRIDRPHLASRVDRAGNILVAHLSCRRQRLIRVRVAGGRARFLVSGSGGAVYVVDPASGWSCTCPDHHRRGAGCKHSIACWALWRAQASRPADRVAASLMVAENTEWGAGGETSSYEERECAGCSGGMTYDGGAGSWVVHEGCSGTGRARVFVYPKTRRLRTCASCGDRFAGRELVEDGPEQAEWALAVSEGDVLCRHCARRHGVL